MAAWRNKRTRVNKMLEQHEHKIVLYNKLAYLSYAEVPTCGYDISRFGIPIRKPLKSSY